jgi:uncharacterized C2H2 Zn-finger protein
MGSEPPSKIRCPICSRLFLDSSVVGHLVREHPESIPELLANYRESLSASTNEPTVFRCTGCKRVFDTEEELTRHWYGRHGQSVNGQPDQPSEPPSPELSPLLTQFEAEPKSPSLQGRNQASSEACQSEAFGPSSATWNSCAHKLRKGGGADRGYSNVENRRMAKRARLLSEATVKPLTSAEPHRGYPIQPPLRRPNGGGLSGDNPLGGSVEDYSSKSPQQALAPMSPSIWAILKIKKARTLLSGLIFGRAHHNS